AEASSTIIEPASGRCIYISGANVDISGFTITGGNDSILGGGILNNGTLNISNSTITGNTADSDGGGIYNDGTLTITSSTISGNTAYDKGGCIYNVDGTLTITGSTISGNTAYGDGGGIYNNDDTTVNITNSTISGNTATNYDGGGIYNDHCTVNITNSNISDNTATNGGGIYNDYSTLNITNSTISDNTATGIAGGIFNHASSPTVGARYNWWGDASGPYNESINPSGIGNSVSDNINFAPWSANPAGYSALSNPLSPQDWVFKNLNIDELLALYGPTPEGFVRMFYDSILGRLSDINGQNYWTGQLNSGAFGASQVAEHFIFSDELGDKIDAMNSEEFITFLYNSFLSRNPDSEGFENWLSYMNSGASKLDTLRAFMNNQEWFDICAMFNVVP
ncbi:MAG: DUF4214 domain-containing protein, partial [Actinomycetota bacterium]|nr:DUF4214 domain-containing protein [Actinomycetota bacterium]